MILAIITRCGSLMINELNTAPFILLNSMYTSNFFNFEFQITKLKTPKLIHMGSNVG